MRSEKEIRLADSAVQEIPDNAASLLEDRLDPLFIEASLADMVRRLRRDWIAAIAPYWGAL